MVKRAPNESIHLVRATPIVSKSTVDALRAITSWVDFLSESTGRNLTTSTSQVRIFFETIPQALAAVRELEDRQESFREAIEQLGTRAAGKCRYELKVSIAMATEHPSRAFGGKRSKSKEKE